MGADRDPGRVRASAHPLGRDGYETRTGPFTVYWRDLDHYSDVYDNAPMPYSQFFSDGQAFHGTPGDLFTGGSHG